jgi:cell division control protein 6
MVTKREIEKMAEEAQKQNSLFANKAYLDFLLPGDGHTEISGRVDKASELVGALASGLKQGYAPRFVFVYGRTGSGKSTLVRFVCDSLGLPYRLVNLREARTVFGCAKLILTELGGDEEKTMGMKSVIDSIASAIEAVARGKLFVLVLDEFDALLEDRRGRPTQLLYMLLTEQEKLRRKGQMVSIVAVSNDMGSIEQLDDRVMSRIGYAPEVFFDPYPKDGILTILNERARLAFAKAVDASVMEYCANVSAEEHGDARRAIDLLRIAAEIAGSKNEPIAKNHVDLAMERLQKDRAEAALRRAPYHVKLVCAALARLTFNLEDVEGTIWFSTSALYKQYCGKIVPEVQEGVKPLQYRRFSEILVQLENTGIVVSRTRAGEPGFGKQYRLLIPPETVANCFVKGLERWLRWKNTLLENIESYRHDPKDPNLQEEHRKALLRSVRHAQNFWKDYVGLYPSSFKLADYQSYYMSFQPSAI